MMALQVAIVVMVMAFQMVVVIMMIALQIGMVVMLLNIIVINTKYVKVMIEILMIIQWIPWSSTGEL